MSLLVDLLSRAKTQEAKKDVPPGLRRTVTDGAYRKKTRRKFILLSAVVLLIFLSGYGTIYVMETFRTSLSTTIAAKTGPGKELPTQVSGEQRPAAPPKAESPPGTPVPGFGEKVLPGGAVPQGRLQPTEQRTSKADRSVSREGDSESQPVSKPQAQDSPVKTGTREQRSAERTHQAEQKTNKDVYLHAARTHEGRGDFKGALGQYTKALELDPANYIIMNNIAAVYIRLNLFNDALVYSRKAIDSKPNYVPALINAGIAQVSMRNPSEGESFLSKAVGLEPSNKVALFNLAVLFEKQDKYDKAYENYYKLSQMQDVEGCLGAARILEKSGRHQDATRFYREVLAIENAGPSARQFANQQLGQLLR